METYTIILSRVSGNECADFGVHPSAHFATLAVVNDKFTQADEK